MRYIIATLVCVQSLVALALPSTSYTEWYCQTTGDNLNAGSTSDNAANFTYSGGTFVRATGIFTVGSGNPSSDGVTNGAWASIYTTSGATVATCVGLVTNVTTTTITISLSAIGGATANVSESAAASTCKIGGAWAGPNTNQNPSVTHPLNFMAAAMTNTTGFPPCLNVLAGVYPCTNTITLANNGAPMIFFQGYTNTPHDWGRASIVGSPTFTIANAISISANYITISDFEFAYNGNGNGTQVNSSGTGNYFYRCIVHDSARIGASGGVWYDSEAYWCNRAGAASIGAFAVASCTRCISHHNTNSGTIGFSAGGPAWLNCISVSNASDGFRITGSGGSVMSCDAYHNADDGIDASSASSQVITIENCNLFGNTSYGINSSGAATRAGSIAYNNFGSGSETNGLGSLFGGLVSASTNAVIFLNNYTYSSGATPYSAPSTGNFTITAANAKNAGRGTFTETGAAFSGTLGYPPIGAAVATNNAASASGGSYTFAQ